VSETKVVDVEKLNKNGIQKFFIENQGGEKMILQTGS